MSEVAAVIVTCILCAAVLGLYMLMYWRWSVEQRSAPHHEMPLSPWHRYDVRPQPRRAIHPEPPPKPMHKPVKQPPTFKVINTTSHPCTVTVTSMGPGEYHITLSDAGEQSKG